MLTLKIIRESLPIINDDKSNDNIPKEFNGLPVVRKPKELNRRGLTNKNIIIHPSGIKLSKCPNGYIILCAEADCGSVGYKGNIKCIKHMEIHRWCRESGCEKRANFGYEWKKSLYCASHKRNDMIDVIHKKCVIADCGLMPYFGYEIGKADYCSKHKLDGMVDVIHKRCIAQGCMKSRSFGKEGGSAEYCAEHKPSDTINLHNKRCIAHKCHIIASFGNPGGPKQYCVTHKLKDMINFSTKKCAVIECMIVPSFGYPGGSCDYCKKHMLEGMVNVKDKRCLYPGCMIGPYFGVPDGKVIYCNSHKQDGMINLRNKRCIFPDCMTRARFCLLGDKAMYCAEHKLFNMVNIKDKKCLTDDCEHRPSYYLLFSNSKIHCKNHASLNEYSHEKRNPICIESKCMRQATFIKSDDNTIHPIHCSDHKSQDDIELINRICHNCEQSVYYPINKDLCMDCGRYREIIKVSARETAIERLLLDNNIEFIHDKRISNHGSRHRPDFLISSCFGYIIIEVDENQHNKYLEFEEKERMRTIYNDIQLATPGKQVLFLRYNPDKYDGIQLDDKKRLEYLLVVINSMKQLTTIGTQLAYVKLFFNGFNGSPVIQPLDIIYN